MQTPKFLEGYESTFDLLQVKITLFAPYGGYIGLLITIGYLWAKSSFGLGEEVVVTAVLAVIVVPLVIRGIKEEKVKRLNKGV